MSIETPESVSNRVYHEEDIPPGSICRRHHQEEDEGWVPGDWFVVVSEPKTSDNTGTDYVFVVWLTGDGARGRERFYLGDLGAKPPHRGVTEKHEFQIPEKYIATSWLQRFIVSVIL